MKLSLRTKTACMTVVILFFAIGASGIISSYFFTKEYSNALRSKIFVIGQSLAFQLDKLLKLEIPIEELTGFEKPCQEVVDKFGEISYAMVVNNEGMILFHNDPSQHGKIFTDFTMLHKGQHDDITLPVFDHHQEHIATVRIGFPVNLVTQKTQRLIAYSLGVTFISLALATILMLFGLFVWITKPLKHLSRSAARLAVGDIQCEIPDIESHDEIGTLSRAFNGLSMYFREMVNAAEEISKGNLSQNIHPKSEHDVLGYAFLDMSIYLNEIASAATALAVGDLHQDIKAKTEHDVLGNAFQQMITYFRDAAEVAQKLAVGDIQVDIKPKSDRDVFNRSFAKTIQYIREVTNIAEKISKMDLHVTVTPKSDQDVLNNSLQRMVITLQTMIRNIEKAMAQAEQQKAEAERQKTVVEQQNWFKTGQAELHSTMRGEQDLSTLSKNIITYLARYLQAQVGTIYLVNSQNSLQLTGSYAYIPQKAHRNEFKFGEGLVGQVAREKQSILLEELPEDYIKITSGVGDSIPHYFLITPFMYEGNVKGVIELGTSHKFTEIQQEFLNQAIENIAITINMAQDRAKMQELLGIHSKAKAD